MWSNAETLSDAYQETMRPDVLADVVHFRLLDIAQIADAEGEFARNGSIECQQVAPFRCADKGGGYDVMVVVTTIEYFVVRLSEKQTPAKGSANS